MVFCYVTLATIIHKVLLKKIKERESHLLKTMIGTILISSLAVCQITQGTFTRIVPTPKPCGSHSVLGDEEGVHPHAALFTAARC